MGACMSAAKSVKSEANKTAPEPEASKEKIASSPAPELQVEEKEVVAEEKMCDGDVQETNKATEEPKKEEPIIVEQKPVEPVTVEPRKEEPVIVEPKPEEPVVVELKPEEPIQVGPKTEEVSAMPAETTTKGKGQMKRSKSVK